MSQIGVDSLRLFCDSFKIKKNHKFKLNTCNIPKENKKPIAYQNGDVEYYSFVSLNNSCPDKIQSNVNAGGITSKVSVPHIAGNGFDLYGAKENKIAIEYIFDTWTDSGILFNPEDIKNSRIDITRNIETNYQPTEYYSLMKPMPYSRINYDIGTSHYSGSKSQMSLVYDKIKEYQDHKKPILDHMKGKNILRFEHRLLKASALRTAMKHECITNDLSNLSTLTDPKKFQELQKLHLIYNNLLLPHHFMAKVESDKEKQIRYVRNLTKNKVKARDIIIMLFDNSCLTIDEIIEITYENRSKQSKYDFKTRMQKKFDRIGAKAKLPPNELYQELRSKALAA